LIMGVDNVVERLVDSGEYCEFFGVVVHILSSICH
jgi:hypothetical protein